MWPGYGDLQDLGRSFSGHQGPPADQEGSVEEKGQDGRLELHHEVEEEEEQVETEVDPEAMEVHLGQLQVLRRQVPRRRRSLHDRCYPARPRSGHPHSWPHQPLHPLPKIKEMCMTCVSVTWIVRRKKEC